MVARSAHSPRTEIHTPLSASAGFAMVELLVILAVASIVVTLGLLVINPPARAAESANNTRIAEMMAMREALEEYATMNNGQYPSTNGQYWCQDCTYDQYESRGVNNWIPELVADGYISSLPKDSPAGQGTACIPDPTNSYAGYVYFSPPPPHNTEYKLFALCTPPPSALNVGNQESETAYCQDKTTHDSSSFNPRPAGQPPLKPFVDPVRPTYAYAVYSPGLACL